MLLASLYAYPQINFTFFKFWYGHIDSMNVIIVAYEY